MRATVAMMTGRTICSCRRTKLKSALRLHDHRTQKNDSNKEVWLKLLADPDYKAGLKERYKVEPKFGAGKNQHGTKAKSLHRAGTQRYPELPDGDGAEPQAEGETALRSGLPKPELSTAASSLRRANYALMGQRSKIRLRPEQ